MGSFIKFIRESYIELTKKVTWPKFKELQKSSTLVLIASFIFAIVIFVMDFAFEWILDMVYGTK